MMDHYYDKLLQVNNIVIIKMYVCNLFLPDCSLPDRCCPVPLPF